MTTDAEIRHLEEHGLYSSANEHDACGLGFVAHTRCWLHVSQAASAFGALRGP